MFVKNNIFYFLTLILIFVTYFWVEKPEYDQLKNEINNRFIFKSIIADRIYLKNITLKRENENWSFGTYKSEQLDQQKINDFISRIKNLKVINIILDSAYIDINWSKFAITDVNNKNHELWIGQKQPYSEKFYIKYINEKYNEMILLVQDLTPQKEPIPDQLFNVNPYKRLKLINFINNNPIDLIKRKIFDNDNKFVEFEKNNGRFFKIEVPNLNLSSSNINKYNVDKNNLKNWYYAWINLTASNVLLENPKLELNFLGKIKTNKKNYDVFLSSKKNEEKVFLWDRENHLSYVYNTDDIPILFPSFQNFISRKFFPELVQKLDVKVDYDEKMINLQTNLINDQLSVKGDNTDKVKLGQLGKMIEFLFLDADYINWGNEMTILPENLIKMKIGDNKLIFGQAHGVVEVFDLLNKQSFFYRNLTFNKLVKNFR